MADEKKSTEETKLEKTEQGEQKTEQKSSEENPAEPTQREQPKTDEKPTDEKQADENGEGADEPPKQEEKPTDLPTEEAEPPKLSAEDELKAENFQLKTQIEAMKIGFSPDVIEDAVVLAENIVKRGGSDITAALNAVAKKYPDWKADSKNGKSKGGFKVGAGTSGSKPTSNEKLNKAFGIKKVRKD